MKRPVITLAALLAFTSPVFACKCAPPMPGLNLKTRRAWAEWRFQHAEVVFEGKVERIDPVGWPLKPVPGKTVRNRYGVKVTFSEVRSYRGAPREQYTVETGFGGGDCGYFFKPGESYLVDAYADDSGQLGTGICGGTARLEDSGAALRLLRGEPPAPEDVADLDNESDSAPRNSSAGKICGKVGLPEGVKLKPVSVLIWFADPPNQFPGDNVESGADGSFCFDGSDPGKYLIGAIQPAGSSFRYVSYYPGVLQRAQATAVELESGKGIEHIDFKLVRQPLFSVSGYLRGVPEPQVASIQVVLMSDQPDALHVVEPVALGAHGTFKIRGIPPGHYAAFAMRENDEEESTTFVSSVVELDVLANVDDLKLDFVPAKK
ncbi:MAG TPA: hypothetical protein VF532_08290 [Candidatus Angelobacter sp.]